MSALIDFGNLEVSSMSIRLAFEFGNNLLFCVLVYGFGTSFDDVLLEHGEIPFVLPLAVHLDLGHLPDTQGYLGLVSEPCTQTSKSYRVVGLGGGVGGP